MYDNQSNYSKCVTYIKNGNLLGINQLLAQPNSRQLLSVKDPKDGFTLLHEAAFEGQWNIFKRLLQHGFNPTELCNLNKRNVLHYAARKGEKEIVEMLASQYPDPALINQTDRNGYTPIGLTVRENHHSCFEALLLKGADFTQAGVVMNTNPTFQAYFFTSKTFFIILQSKNQLALDTICTYIKSSHAHKQAPFLETLFQNGRHALLEAAFLGYQDTVLKLLTLNFNIFLRDPSGNSLLYYLDQKRFINQEILNLIIPFVDNNSHLSRSDAAILSRYSAELSNYGDTRKIGKALTWQYQSTYEGYVPKTYRPQCDKSQCECERPPRSFATEKERQLLRQIGTQLFFAFKEQINSEDLVEVQVMHLEVDGKHNLYIATNKAYLTPQLNIGRLGELRELLIQSYGVPSKPDEGFVRSLRYSNKLQQRVYFPPTVNNPAPLEVKVAEPSEADRRDAFQANCIANILRYGKNQTLNITKAGDNSVAYNRALQEENTIFLIQVVDAHDKYLRHAEEFLVDIVDHARATLSPRIIYSCIGGKKRPCMGCSGRMAAARVDQYGLHPGRLWLNTIAAQPAQVAQRTVNLLLTQQSCITTTVRGSFADYDSASDSEAEIPAIQFPPAISAASLIKNRICEIHYPGFEMPTCISCDKKFCNHAGYDSIWLSWCRRCYEKKLLNQAVSDSDSPSMPPSFEPSGMRYSSVSPYSPSTGSSPTTSPMFSPRTIQQQSPLYKRASYSSDSDSVDDLSRSFGSLQIPPRVHRPSCPTRAAAGAKCTC